MNTPNTNGVHSVQQLRWGSNYLDAYFGGRFMPPSFASVLLHWVFSTKDRYPYFSAREKDELFSVLGGKCKTLDCNPVVVGVAE